MTDLGGRGLLGAQIQGQVLRGEDARTGHNDRPRGPKVGV